jgi:hypothetical protein
MKRQLQNQQAIQHMLNTAKSQAKSTIVKTPKLPQPKVESKVEPKKEEPKVEIVKPKIEPKVETTPEIIKPIKSEKTLPRL